MRYDRRLGTIKHRSSNGMSLIEMLTAMMLTGFIAAATCDMMAALSLVSLKADYQLSSSIQCKRALDLLGQQIRSAHKLNTVGGPRILKLSIPITGDQTKGGLAGVPLSLNALECTDEYTYSVVADKDKPGSGEFVLQRTRTSIRPENLPASTTVIAANQPQILVKGIVGPQDLLANVDPVALNYPPKTFVYLSSIRNAINDPPTEIKSPYPELDSTASGISADGLAIQLEIQPSQIPNAKVRSTTFGLRSEYFVRGAAYGQ
jgi:prepilin-type N-terminal cleavage/methylation domain-containing protein